MLRPALAKTGEQNSTGQMTEVVSYTKSEIISEDHKQMKKINLRSMRSIWILKLKAKCPITVRSFFVL